jgi:hypothetical protein
MDLHDTTIHEEQRQLREMLGDCTAAEFLQLPAKREKVYRDHLLREDAIIGMQDVSPGFTDMPNGTMLLQEYYMGCDDIGKQLVTEAREFFYRANMFSVPSHRLGEFVQDPLVNGNSVDVAQLVQRIIVRVYNVERLAGPKDKAHKRGLDCLSKFTNAAQIDIELVVRGAVNGLDLKTQLIIKEISGVVKGLIDQFGDKVRIRTESAVSLRVVNIRPYWDSPGVDSVEKLRQGRDCSFEELMQIQIAKWTGVLPKVFDVHGDSVSLL